MYPALFCLLALLQAGFGQEPEGVAISRLLSERHVPGVSIARIKGGKLVQTTAYGQQSAEVAATPDTIYNIASLTKPISAEVALRLVSKRTITLDEPMYKAWTAQIADTAHCAEPPDGLCQLAFGNGQCPHVPE